MAENPHTIVYFRRGMKTERTTTFLFFFIADCSNTKRFFWLPNNFFVTYQIDPLLLKKSKKNTTDAVFYPRDI